MLELERFPTYFEFLVTAPYVTVNNPAVHDDCPMCKALYEWQPVPRATMNQPVALSCGHNVGIQCLAEWMLSQNFDGRCFYCRTLILDPIRNPNLLQAQNPIVTAAFIDLETLCHFDGQISTS